MTPNPSNTPGGLDPSNRRCTARRSDGAPCGRWAIKGGTVCPAHGGAAAQVRQAGQRRVAMAAAQQAVRRALDDPTAPPVRDPLRRLAVLAGRLEHAADVIGTRVNDLSSIRYEGAQGGEQLRAEVGVWERVLAQLRSALTDLARLGFEDHAARINRKQGDQIAAAFNWIYRATVVLTEADAATQVALREALLAAVRVMVADTDFADLPLPTRAVTGSSE